MTRRLVVRPRARADLEQIWVYTVRHWGKAEADAYLAQLEEAFARIAQQPNAGSDRRDIQPGVRKITVKSHAIYYFVEGQTVRVSRVLHVRRDAGREL